MHGKKQGLSTLLALLVLAALMMLLNGCGGSAASTPNPVTPPSNKGLESINHVIFMIQENRSFDHYFGAMRQYWANNGIPDQSFDGLAQFNPTTGAAPLQGPAPTSPGCDPEFPFPANDCTVTGNSPAVAAFHMTSMCIENPSPSFGT
jgi:phospholipase C